jgi:hypothetical protein
MKSPPGIAGCGIPGCIPGWGIAGWGIAGWGIPGWGIAGWGIAGWGIAGCAVVGTVVAGGGGFSSVRRRLQLYETRTLAIIAARRAHFVIIAPSSLL